MSAQQQEVAVAAERTLSVQLAERSITNAQWHTLSKSLYPGASQASVLMVIDYCRARNLDPLKKPCHIVPMQVKVGRDYEWRDVILPGIYELRTTAMRTGLYLGHSKPEYGPEIEYLGVKAPEYVDLVIYRWNDTAKLRGEFPVRVRFVEVCGTTWDKEAKVAKVNARWTKAPVQMMVKCGEAAGLREAFPDELGGQMTVEEMEGQRQVIDVTPTDDLDVPEGTQEKRIGHAKLRDTVEKITKYTENKDGDNLMKLWREFDQEQQLYVWRFLLPWVRRAFKEVEAIARKTTGIGDLPSFSVELAKSCKNSLELDTAWKRVQDAFTEADQEIPDNVLTAFDEARSAMGAN